MQMHMIESVISLLRESKPMNFDPGKDSSSVISAVAESKTSPNGIHEHMSLEERQLLGRYGIWLLVGRCTPTADTPMETLGRLLGMLFHWFHVTAYSYDCEFFVCSKRNYSKFCKSDTLAAEESEIRKNKPRSRAFRVIDVFAVFARCLFPFF